MLRVEKCCVDRSAFHRRKERDIMVSPEHVDEQKSENEHVVSPTEEKQVLRVDEEKRPWLNPLMRVISVVLALGGSCAAVLVISTGLISIELFYNYDLWLI